MKILLFNPAINAEHEIARALHSRGVGILFPTTVEEAWQMLQLHGTSIDLAVIQREGANAVISENEPGIRFITRVKADPAQSDLPIILTSNIWGEREFSRHQQSALGVNAYLSAPYKEPQLIQMVEAVLGQTLGADTTGSYRIVRQPGEPPTAATATPLAVTPMAAPAKGPVLEEAASLYVEPARENSGGIMLEAAFDAPSIPTAASSSGLDLSPEMILEPVEAEPLDDTRPVSLGGGEPIGDDAATAVAIPRGRAPSQGLEELSIATGLPIGRAPGPASADPREASVPGFDEQLKQELPYLYGDRERTSSRVSEFGPEVDFRTNHAMLLGRPLGDAVVPGGAAQAPDAETLKKYLLLREQDVAVLSSQLRTAQEQVKSLEGQLREEKGRAAQSAHVAHEQQQKIDDFERAQSVAVESLQSEITDLRFELKTRADKARGLESQVKSVTDEIERLKERVRLDIRKIRVREKDLENKLEIARKDSEALIAARENKIMELKRKLDLVEFNLDLLQNQYVKEKEVSATLRERLVKAAQVVRVAGGLLDQPAGARSANPAATSLGGFPALDSEEAKPKAS